MVTQLLGQRTYFIQVALEKSFISVRVWDCVAVSVRFGVCVRRADICVYELFHWNQKEITFNRARSAHVNVYVSLVQLLAILFISHLFIIIIILLLLLWLLFVELIENTRNEKRAWSKSMYSVCSILICNLYILLFFASPKRNDNKN